MALVLVVEDDATIGRALMTGLQSHSHRVVWAEDGADALAAVKTDSFDLVLLDLGLPDVDGVELCRTIRSVQPGCVIVILTARDEEIDVVVGLEAGADDYLTKPFRLGELLARIRAHLRRGSVRNPAAGSLRVGLLVVDVSSRRVYLGQREIVLRAKEFDLLARLAAEPGAALSRSTLMTDVWDEHWFGSTKTLDVHVSALRRKLVEAGQDEGCDAPDIVTLRGHGFRLQ
jgi:DNA-binding response OmpR family regulator